MRLIFLNCSFFMPLSLWHIPLNACFYMAFSKIKPVMMISNILSNRKGHVWIFTKLQMIFVIQHSFGLRLAKLREAAGISARQMSLDLGLNKNYINSIESGKNYPALEGFFNICDYLHVDPFTFFYTDDNTYQSFAYFIPLLQKLNSEEIQHVYQMVKNVTEYPSRQTKTKANRFIPTK